MVVLHTLEEVEVVAVQGHASDVMPWRSLAPVFRLKADHDRIVWPLRIHHSHVRGRETSVSVLADSVSEGSATLLNEPIQACVGYRMISTEAGLSYRPMNDVYAKRMDELTGRLTKALGLLKEAYELDDLQDAFDGAYLVDPGSLVAATLRAGAAAQVKDDVPDWFEIAVSDLEEFEASGASLDTVLRHPLTAKLPKMEIQELYKKALWGLVDYREEHSKGWEPPVSQETQLSAVRFAHLHAAQPDVTRSLKHRVLRDALRGSPKAIVKVNSTLDVALESVELASSWEGLFHASKSATNLSSIANATVTDRRHFSNNIYRLELGADEPDRRSIWRSFLRRSKSCQNLGASVPWRQGEELANSLRYALGVSDAVESMKLLAMREIGAYIAEIRIPGPASVAAATALSSSPPCIYTNEATRPSGTRRLLNRFSIAHEIAHLVIDRQHGTCDWACVLTLEEETFTAREDSERRANAFASYFLAPREEVLKQIPKPQNTESDEFVKAVLGVREMFGLSMIAAGEHLVNCYEDLRPVAGRPLPASTRQRLRNAVSEPIKRFIEDEEIDKRVSDGPRLYSGHYTTLVERLEHAHLLDFATARSLLPEKNKDPT